MDVSYPPVSPSSSAVSTSSSTIRSIDGPNAALAGADVCVVTGIAQRCFMLEAQAGTKAANPALVQSIKICLNVLPSSAPAEGNVRTEGSARGRRPCHY